jgi:hypothetical protein
MGLLETATASLAAQLRTHTAIDVVYSRSMASISVKATRAATPYESSDTDGIIHRTVARDYLIATTDFPFVDPPRNGDTITDSGDVYLVHSMTGETPWRYSDPGRSLMRIHTKKQ